MELKNNVADKISFSNFCTVCDQISSAVKVKKTTILSTFINLWKDVGRTLTESQTQVIDSFFPILRFLLPQLDRERGAYGVKENTLAKIYIRILGLPKDARDAHKLLEYRAPKTAGSQAGDFAEVAYWILKSRCSTGGKLSVADVNKHLDLIAEKHANHDPRGVDQELFTLLTSMSAEEQKWLIRILLKEMKLGIGHKNVLNTFHPDADALYDVSNNLFKVCHKLKDTSVRLHEVEIEVFSPFRPMLSEECNVRNVDNYFKKCSYFYIETKFDGERFQMHMEDGNFKYFSRNSFDYTSTYGATDRDGILTPQLSKQLSPGTRSVILDGEMMAWNSESNHFTQKGMNVDVKTLNENSRLRPCYCVFDILYHNGEVLTDKPLTYRIDKLKHVVTPCTGVVQLSECEKVSTKQEIWNCLNVAIDNRQEGIVMKEFMSVYKPNVRKGGGWYKIKPEYTDGLMDQCDVVILGGYHGGGRHKGGISHFLVGVAVPPSPPATEPHLFYSMGRVGSGYNMEELSELQTKLEPHWNVTKPDVMPDNIVWTKEKPDVWIEPSKSYILQVKASEINPGDGYKTNFTLRFPRVEKIRYDKTWKDCMTTVEFEDKMKNASGKLFSRHVEETEQDEPQVKKKRITKQVIAVGSQFRAGDVTNVTTESNLLIDKEICVIAGCGKVTKQDLEKMIVKYGGTVVQNPGSSTFCVAAQKQTLRVVNLIRSNQFDVVKSSVLIDKLKPGSEVLDQWVPGDLLGMSTVTRTRLMSQFDEFGDSYTEHADCDKLLQVAEAVQAKCKLEPLDRTAMAELDCELFPSVSPFSMFRCTRVYFDAYSTIGDSSAAMFNKEMMLCCIRYKFYGGLVSVDVSHDVTHVALSTSDLTRLQNFKDLRRNFTKKFHIVTTKFVEDCIEQKDLLTTDEYEL